MSEKTKKIIGIVIAIVVGLLICGGVVTSFLLNYNTTAPEAISIFDDGKVVGLMANMNDNYKGYIFKFTQDYQEPILIESEQNILKVSSMVEKNIKIGEEYGVSVCYKAENSGNNSEYSNMIRWKVYDYLNSPVLTYNEQNNTIEWQDIDNADSYEVTYNTSSGVKKLEIEDTYLSLQKVEGGEREFSVIAKSEKDYFKAKHSEQSLKVTVVHHMQEIVSISLNEETKVLTIVAKENLSKVMIYIGDNEFETHTTFSFNSTENVYTCAIDLTAIYPTSTGEEDEEPLKIGVAPISIDRYNVFDGEITYNMDE